ncbi:MAG: peptide chain release factor N(5)-glutamine methyltransferase [Hyphomicrobiales bacterium]
MKVRSNQIIDIKNYYLEELAKIYNHNEALQLIKIVFEHHMGIPPNQLALHYDDRLSESEMLKIHFTIKDLLKKKPIQYVLGNTSFLEHTFDVEENVLIPRPETEELILWIMENFNQNDKIKILDIGTGSGCIAISLKKAFPNAEVSAIDKFDTPLKVASQNAIKLDADINIIKCDILNESDRNQLGQYDIIVSNPPYVKNSEKQLMHNNVLDYEPHEALFVDDNDPLIFYKEIGKFGQNHLNEEGKIFFEINEALGKDMTQLMHQLGYNSCSIKKDIFNKDRMMLIQK